MACLLTQSFPLDCRDAVGGIKAVRFASLAQWTTLGASVASGEVQSFSNASSVFYTYAQLKESSFASDNIAGSMSAGTLFYTPTLTVILPKLSAAKAREILLLGKNRLVALVESNDGTIYVLGAANGVELVTGTGATGTAFGDLNGYTLNFEGRESEPFYTVSLALADSVSV